MTDADGEGRGWLKLGCLAVAALLGMLGVGGGIVAVVALRQIGSDAPERQAFEREARAATGGGRLELEVAVARLIVAPAAAGEPIRIEADYDPRRYTLDQQSEEPAAGRWVHRVRLAPNYSETFALLKLKLGGEPPLIRIALPRDVPLVLTGEVRGAFAAMELGGLRIDTAELTVSGGAVMVSFLTPLAAPMDLLNVTGDKGLVEVTGLGNASPRRAVLGQRLGELDVDLRGAWVRDAEIELNSSMAGGSVWLPHDVVIEGLEDRIGRPRTATDETLPLPRLRLSVSAGSGRMMFVD